MKGAYIDWNLYGNEFKDLFYSKPDLTYNEMNEKSWKFSLMGETVDKADKKTRYDFLRLRIATLIEHEFYDWALKDLEYSEQNFQDLCKNNPSHYMYKGQAFFGKSKWKNALDNIEKSNKLSPNAGLSSDLDIMAICLIKLKRVDEAKEVIEEYKKLAQKWIDYRKKISDENAIMGKQKELKEHLEKYAKLIEEEKRR